MRFAIICLKINDENERIHRILEHLYLLAMGEKRL